MTLSKDEINDLVNDHGDVLLESPGMVTERRYIQHGVTSTYEHSKRVAVTALRIMDLLGLERKTNIDDVVKAALLHDYFLYDWHMDEPWHRMHGFTHGATALANARRDFPELMDWTIEDSVLRHMYPLTKTPPKFIEGWLITAADKTCAWAETFDAERIHKRKILENRVLDSLPCVPSSAKPVADYIIEERIRKMMPADTGRTRRGIYKCLAAARRAKADIRSSTSVNGE